VLAGLDAADVSLDRAGSKTESILQCVEYSHGNLSAAAQRVLLCLALFSGFMMRSTLTHYVKHLQAGGSGFIDLTVEALAAAVTEAITWGLLTPMAEENPHLLTIQPVFPYFLKTKLAQEDEALRDALQLGFKNYYEGLARDYRKLMGSDEAQTREWGVGFCKLEYENLYTALQIALKRREDPSIFLTLDFYHRVQNDTINRLLLAQSICKVLVDYPVNLKLGDVGKNIVHAFERLAECYSNSHKYDDAKTTYAHMLTTVEELVDVDEQWKQILTANIYQQLGLIFQKLQEHNEARRNYQKALEINAEFNNPEALGSNYHNLGWVAEELREYEEARTNYQQALKIYSAFGDRYEQAGTYHQLGIVSCELREYEQARTEYQKALNIFIEFNDWYEQARVYGSLGNLATELQEFETARTEYQKALKIFIEIENRFFQANTYRNLGNVAQYLEEHEQARNDYQQALKIYVELDNRYSQASIYHNLGAVSQRLCEFEQARNNYQQALEIWFEFSDRYSQAGTYRNLGLIAEELQEFDEAGTIYLKALTIYVEFKDQHNLAIVIESCGRIYQAHPSPQFLTQVAQSIGSSEAEVLQLFEPMG
jgi:tetratricopeptide (TPR) repeat protein